MLPAVPHSLSSHQVLSYFSSRLESPDKHVSVSEVMDSIKEAALHWPTDRLKVQCNIFFFSTTSAALFLPCVSTFYYLQCHTWRQHKMSLFCLHVFIIVYLWQQFLLLLYVLLYYRPCSARWKTAISMTTHDTFTLQSSVHLYLPLRV